MNETTFSNNLINSSIFYLLNFEKYSDFQQAAKQAAINNNFQIVLFSEDFNVLFSVETRHNQTIEQAVLSTFTQNIDRDQRGALVDVDGLSTYWGPISIKGNKFYLMLVDNDKYYTQEEITKLAEIIELAMGMWNYVPYRDPQSEFIRALRRNNKDLAKTLGDELKVGNGGIAGVFLISGIRKTEARELFAQFSATHSMTTIASYEQDEICGVILNDADYSEIKAEDWEEFASVLHRECGAQKVMYVTGLETSEDACSGFRIIAESEAFVQIVFPYRHSFGKFDMIFINNCCQLSRNGGNTKQECLGLIKTLLSARDQKTRQLLDTLLVFILDAGMSAVKTSEMLDVHANTVQYRLKHLKEILGVDISGSAPIPSLMTALAIARIDKEAGPFYEKSR